MYSSKELGYNPLLGDRNESISPHSESDTKSEELEHIPSLSRESKAWFGNGKLPESMNFEELESVMWRKVSNNNFLQAHYLRNLSAPTETIFPR